MQPWSRVLLILLPRPKWPSWGKPGFAVCKIWSGQVWYINFWVPGPPSPSDAFVPGPQHRSPKPPHGRSARSSQAIALRQHAPTSRGAWRGRVRGQTQVCAPKMGLPFRAGSKAVDKRHHAIEQGAPGASVMTPNEAPVGNAMECGYDANTTSLRRPSARGWRPAPSAGGGWPIGPSHGTGPCRPFGGGGGGVIWGPGQPPPPDPHQKNFPPGENEIYQSPPPPLHVCKHVLVYARPGFLLTTRQPTAEVCGQPKQSNDPRNHQHILNTPIIGRRRRANGTPRHIQHSLSTPTTGLGERGNDTSRSTGRSGRQNAATRRKMRREERVTVQGPVKKQQPDALSHGGGGGLPFGPFGSFGPTERGCQADVLRHVMGFSVFVSLSRRVSDLRMAVAVWCSAISECQRTNAGGRPLTVSPSSPIRRRLPTGDGYSRSGRQLAGVVCRAVLHWMSLSGCPTFWGRVERDNRFALFSTEESRRVLCPRCAFRCR